jgi:hypothetical protein
MKVTEWATVKADAASTTSRRRRDPAISARRNRMWSMPVSKWLDPRLKNSQKRWYQVCSVENDGLLSSTVADPDCPSTS